MQKSKSTVTIIFALFLFFAATAAQAQTVRISVAASMTDVFKELIATFTKQHPGVTIQPNFGPSGGLAKQIDQGAPADLYVSANPKWMKYLIDHKCIDAASNTIFAHNTLVFAGWKEHDVQSMQDLPRLERIGIGSPGSVPAGQYAKQALENAGLWDALQKAHKLVMAKDVRQALMYANRGETNGSFIYKTDALLATKAVILFEVPQKLYNPVTYPLALTSDGARKAEAKAFYDYITSPAGAKIESKYGFTVPK